MGKRRFPCLLIVVPLACLLLVGVYYLPPVNERLAWRVSELRARVKYALNPPEQAVFVPQGQPTGLALATAIPSATALPAVTLTPTPGPTASPTLTPTATFTPTPLPESALLNGIPHYYQTWNNCGPANLAMALAYWGWVGDQRDTAAYLKPNARDKNVMPYEMADYVTENTGLRAVMRVGGDLELLKAFISAGIPVIVEKGFEGDGFDGWMGHYEVITGYDDAAGVFTGQDSYKGPNQKVPYEALESQWRAFNFTYILPYPPEREADVLAILGPHSDPQYSYTVAAERAAGESASLTGRDQFFAWFNRGASLVYLHDYNAAATAFDAAFAHYAALPEAERPYRMLWYQTGPYFAYYYTQRYEDVERLATETLDAMSEPVLEESYYWRARARLALGNTEAAVEDLQTSLKHHPGFLPSLEELSALGIES